MKKFRLLEYKHTGKPLNWGISAWTKLFNWDTPSYSHSEIWLPDEDGEFVGVYECAGGVKYLGQCFTSTMRAGANGTVIRPAFEVLKHPEHWDYCDIEVDTADYKEAIHLARVAFANNTGYDKPALLSFFFPIRFGTKGKDICSEVCERFMIWCGIWSKETKPSPRRLCRNAMKLGYEFKSLKYIA